MADISFNTDCKQLEIAQNAQFKQLFQLLHLGIEENVNNDASKDSPIAFNLTKAYCSCFCCSAYFFAMPLLT